MSDPVGSQGAEQRLKVAWLVLAEQQGLTTDEVSRGWEEVRRLRSQGRSISDALRGGMAVGRG